MFKAKKVAVISTLLIPILALIIYLDTMYLYTMSIEILCYYMILLSVLVAITAWVMTFVRWAAKKRMSRGLEVKPCRHRALKTFGIVNIVFLIISIVYGVTDGGLGGGVMLLFVSPVFAAMIALDIMVYVVKNTGIKGKAIWCTVATIIASALFLLFRDIVSFLASMVLSLLSICLWIVFVRNKLRSENVGD